MAGTYSKLLYHTVFSTKNRQLSISQDIEPRLHEYMGGIVRPMDGVAMRIGGVRDHVHMLVRLGTDKAVAELLRTVKSRSSKWVHDTYPAFRDFGWQEGYGAFTVSHSQAPTVDRYIANQKSHHCGRAFDAEYLELLRAHAIEFDPQYVCD
jgi:REP element-mobilizing transposase RayT